MLNRLLLVASLLIFAIAAYSSLRGARPHAQRVVKTFHKTLGKYKVELTEVDEQPASGAYWGAFENAPNSYVDDLSIWYEGEEIYEPMSCYTDLTNVNSLTVVPVKDGLVINIVGGDAGTAYKAQIVCKEDYVVQRSVHDGEFPNEIYEKSQYSKTDLDKIVTASR